MKNNYSSQIVTGFNFLGIYQILGGIIGFVLSFIFIQFAQLSLLALLLVLGAFFLFSYSIFCGVLLLKKKPSGLRHSTINQFLQLFMFSILGYSFKYASGVFLALGFDITNDFIFNLNFGISNWQIEINSGSQTLSLGFNFVALILIFYISKLKIKVQTQWMQDQISEIGESVI